MNGWIGVDLDGTLAEYEGFQGRNHIGKPILLMLHRVDNWLKEGKDVRIFTARVHARQPSEDRIAAEEAIHEWCFKHLGRALPVTCMKDFQMAELWDDRCVQVIPNTGRRADGKGG